MVRNSAWAGTWVGMLTKAFEVEVPDLEIISLSINKWFL